MRERYAKLAWTDWLIGLLKKIYTLGPYACPEAKSGRREHLVLWFHFISEWDLRPNYVKSKVFGFMTNDVNMIDFISKKDALTARNKSIYKLRVVEKLGIMDLCKRFNLSVRQIKKILAREELKAGDVISSHVDTVPDRPDEPA